MKAKPETIKKAIEALSRNDRQLKSAKAAGNAVRGAYVLVAQNRDIKRKLEGML